MHKWINKDTEIYCSFAKTAGNIGCQLINSAFYYYGLNKIYKSFSVNNIENAINAAKTLDIKGFAITMPYKIEALNYINNLSDKILKIGATNTVLNDNGYLTAYNTDYMAALTMLEQYKNDYTSVYILGNGGYARAVNAAVNDCKYQNYNINRNNWNDISHIKNSIIYNCTPVENIHVNNSNVFIDCIATTSTGKKLATMQAAHQFKLYTGLDFPTLG